jgi:hypothetical protein
MDFETGERKRRGTQERAPLAGTEHELTVSSPQPPGFLLCLSPSFFGPKDALPSAVVNSNYRRNVLKESPKPVTRTMSQGNNHIVQVNKGQVVTRAKRKGKVRVMNS